MNCFPILVASAKVLDFDKQVFPEIKNKNVMKNYFFSSFFPRSSLSSFSFSFAFYLEKKSNLSAFPKCSSIREKFPVLPIVKELFKWISSAFKVLCGDHMMIHHHWFKTTHTFSGKTDYTTVLQNFSVLFIKYEFQIKVRSPSWSECFFGQTHALESFPF